MGLSLKAIVIPIDFSPPSNNALRYAIRLADQFGSVLRLVHVLQNPPSTRTDAEIAKAAKVKLQALAQDEIDKLIPVYPEVRIGKPHQEIVAAAKVADADLIVIATHGYTGLKHALLGQHCRTRRASCALPGAGGAPEQKGVTTITMDAQRTRQPGRTNRTMPHLRARQRARAAIDNILVAADFSDDSKAALRYAAQLARAFDAVVIVVNVIDVNLRLAELRRR
jgi:nucleotide-binding universal stress UspA family protein